MYVVLPIVSQYLQDHLEPALEFLKGKYPHIDQHTEVQHVSIIQLSWHSVCVALELTIRFHGLDVFIPGCWRSWTLHPLALITNGINILILPPDSKDMSTQIPARHLAEDTSRSRNGLRSGNGLKFLIRSQHL